MAGYSSNPIDFAKKYPSHPILAFKSVNEMKESFDQTQPLAFYYPTVPSKTRDERSIQLLSHFENSIILMEKPSHNNLADAKAFRDQLQQANINVDRVLIGMHSPLHPGREVLKDWVKRYKDEVSDVYVAFNYPKDPYDKDARRTYDKDVGGVMLDLGVYVFNCMQDITEILGFDFIDFAKKEPQVTYKTLKGKTYEFENAEVDFEVTVEFEHEQRTIFASTKMSPGVDNHQGVIVTLKNGDKITQNAYVHPHCSNGVFYESKHGLVTKDARSIDPKSSYAYQLELCEKYLEKIVKEGNQTP